MSSFSHQCFWGTLIYVCLLPGRVCPAGDRAEDDASHPTSDKRLSARIPHLHPRLAHPAFWRIRIGLSTSSDFPVLPFLSSLTHPLSFTVLHSPCSTWPACSPLMQGLISHYWVSRDGWGHLEAPPSSPTPLEVVFLCVSADLMSSLLQGSIAEHADYPTLELLDMSRSCCHCRATELNSCSLFSDQILSGVWMISVKGYYVVLENNYYIYNINVGKILHCVVI